MIKSSQNSLDTLAISLSDTEKKAIIDYSFKILDHFFYDKDDQNDINIQDARLDLRKNFTYDRVFVTLFNGHKIRACCSNVSDNSGNSLGDLSIHILEAVLRCINSQRFGEPLQESELNNINIEICVLHNKTKLPNNTDLCFRNNVKLGVHAVEVKNKNLNAFFKESVPIKYNYDHRTLLNKLIKKAKLNPETFQQSTDSIINTYNVITFKGDRQNKVVSLYKYNVLVKQDSINKSTIQNSLKLAHKWYLNNIDDNSQLLHYEYFPHKCLYNNNRNHVRQLACIWSAAKLHNFLGRSCNQLKKHIETSLRLYISSCQQTSDDCAHVCIKDDHRLAQSAFLILSLLEYSQSPDSERLACQLGNSIVESQRSDGALNTSWGKDDIQSGIDFASGQMILSLLVLYEASKNKKYLDAAAKAFPFYTDYWRKQNSTAFVPWHSQANELLFKHTQRAEIADFTFEMNDWVIDNNWITDSAYPDEVGGAPRNNPRYSAACWSEGINSAYNLALQSDRADHQDKYKHILRLATRFIIQNQYTDENTFFFNHANRLIGGFHGGATDMSIRNDYVQHSVMSLLKTSSNDIF